MENINNSWVEVLPSLINKTKISTMRKAGEIKSDYEIMNYKNSEKWDKKSPIMIYVERPPQYKVGEKYMMVWDEDNINKVFCKKCGYHMVMNHHVDTYTRFIKCVGCGLLKAILPLVHEDNEREIEEIAFLKELGIIEITSVQKITFGYESIYIGKGCKNEKDYWMKIIKEDTAKQHFERVQKITQDEGFNNPEIMFKSFDKWVDLSTPREFWQYNFKWVKE